MDPKDRLFLVNKDLNGVVPAEIQVIPFGRHVTPRYPDQPFLVDDQSEAEVLKNFAATRNDMVIDYEHQTLADPPVAAPAAGWIKKLVNKGREGIWAVVEWTRRAQDMIANKEYRYVSPVFVRRKADGRVTMLLNVALTNQPNIDGMVPLINKFDTHKEEPKMKKLLVLLGLPETATEDEAILAINKIKADNTGVVANKAVLSAAGLSETAPESEIVGTIMAMKQAHVQVSTLQSENTRLKTEAADRVAQELLVNSMRPDDKGMIKIVPAMKDWALDYARRDPEGFKVYVSKAPGILSTEKIAKEEKGGGGEQLDDVTMQVCRMFGNKPEDVLKNKAA
jgi:phage I-like protein